MQYGCYGNLANRSPRCAVARGMGRVMRGDGGSQCQRRDGCVGYRAIRFPGLAELVSVLTHVFCVGAFVNRRVA